MHRTASVNEYSTRYSEAIPEKETTSWDHWRLQSANNKQGSDGYMHQLTDDQVKAWCADNGIEFQDAPDLGAAVGAHTPGQMELPYLMTMPETEFKDRFGDFLGSDIAKYLTTRERQLHQLVDEIYHERLRLGVAREQARKDLTLSNYTEAYWKVDLHNLLHFLRLRLDPHAQKEIREFSEAIANIVREWVPQTWEAFEDYRLHGVTLSRMELEVIRRIVRGDLGIEFDLSETIEETKQLLADGWTEVNNSKFGDPQFARPLTLYQMFKPKRQGFFEECGLDNAREQQELLEKIL